VNWGRWKNSGARRPTTPSMATRPFFSSASCFDTRHECGTERQKAHPHPSVTMQQYPEPLHVVVVGEAQGIEANIAGHFAVEHGRLLEEGDGLAVLHLGTYGLGGCSATCINASQQSRSGKESNNTRPKAEKKASRPCCCRAYRGCWSWGGMSTARRPRPTPSMPAARKRGTFRTSLEERNVEDYVL